MTEPPSFWTSLEVTISLPLAYFGCELPRLSDEASFTLEESSIDALLLSTADLIVFASFVFTLSSSLFINLVSESNTLISIGSVI
jgi:hypothetical protein